MDEQRQDGPLEPTYTSSVLIQDVALKTYREWWMIEKGDRRGLGKSTLAAWHDDDDDEVFLFDTNNLLNLLILLAID